MALPTFADAAPAEPTFLDWLRRTTESRWANTGSRDAATAGLGEPAWQPGTRWRGGMSQSDLDIVEAMFGVHLPLAYRRFLSTLHTPDPPLAALAVRHGRLVRVEERLFPDWTGPTTPLLGAFEAPMEGILRGVAIGRWHPAWGDRPDDARERVHLVRALASAAPRLIPFAGQRYLVALPGHGDGPVIAVHGADVTVIAPDVAGGLLRELGLGERRHGTPAGGSGAGVTRATGPASDGSALVAPGRGASGEREIPFWSDLMGGIPWLPFGAPVRT